MRALHGTSPKRCTGTGALQTPGSAEAQYALGLIYDEGRGVPEDNDQALRWYRLSAAQGDADAQNNLGAMFDVGDGVKQDKAEAHCVGTR